MIAVLLLLIAVSSFMSFLETAIITCYSYPLKDSFFTRYIKKRIDAVYVSIVFYNVLTVVAFGVATGGLKMNLINSLIVIFIFSFFTDLFPKYLARRFAVKISRFVMASGFIVSIPAGYMLYFLTRFFSRVYSIAGFKKEKSVVSIEDVMDILRDTEIKKEALSIGEGLSGLYKTTVFEHMKPKKNVVAFDINTSLPILIDKIIESGYSRVPVYRKSIENIAGIIYTKDLLAVIGSGGVVVLEDIIRQPLYFDSDMNIMEALKEFRKGNHFAVVRKDGKVAGILTITDIIEELFGSFVEV